MSGFQCPYCSMVMSISPFTYVSQSPSFSFSNGEAYKKENGETVDPSTLRIAFYKCPNCGQISINALGMLDQNEIEIVMYGYSNDKIRFYMTTDSMDDAIQICTNIIHLLDDSISDDEIAEEFDSLDTTKYTSLYLGDTGYIGGYIDNCTFMIDCSKIKF